MKPKNLISVLQGSRAIENLSYDVDKKMKILKPHEIENLDSFCRIMKEEGCDIADFDGFFVSYTIAQISKEFDYLRFGTDYILNLEIKDELLDAEKEEKILKQMRKNFYYLKFAEKPICIVTYVENDGFYQYDFENDIVEKIEVGLVAYYLKSQNIDYSVDPDKLFVPSNYLISPFNSTKKFVNGEYFLTDLQQNIKNEINKELQETSFMFFCLSANAGTGKTLLMYDIAKEKIALGNKVLIIHCGKLNSGHEKLIYDYNWRIKPIKTISDDEKNIRLEGYDYIFIDEAQRIREGQLNALIDKISLLQIPTFFSFDPLQYLREGEDRDLTQYLNIKYPHINTSTKKLTNKIRTNKAMSSFIYNLMKIGSSNDRQDYSCVSIDYIENIAELKEYIDFLKENGWMAITYTTAQYGWDPYDELANIGEKNAHAVIGQEFPKVVFVMNENFRYNDAGYLIAQKSYYSAKGMLYQIATRVVDELKIIVLNNPELYVKLLEVKQMGERK